MICKKCGTKNPAVKKTCIDCSSILEGETINNVTGKPGYRNADGSFTPNVNEILNTSINGVDIRISNRVENILSLDVGKNRIVKKRVNVKDYSTETKLFYGEIKHQNKTIIVSSFDKEQWTIELIRTLQETK